MHIARIETRSLDETAEAVDLGQSPAEVVLLSFTDSDLAAFAAAWERMSEPRPSLRLANLAALKHPYSVDLYLETVCSRARFILVRLLGGIEYWRYGVEQLAALAKARGIALALMSGDRFEDARLVKASTLDGASLRLLGSYFEDGGPDNMAACLAFITRGKAPAPRAVAAFGLYEPPHPRPLPAGERGEEVATVPLPALLREGAGEGLSRPARALIVFYRSIYLADDLAPIDALAAALEARGFAVTCAYVTSLKDAAVRAPLSELISREKFDIVLNATAFSARLDEGGGGVLDEADAPVLQVVLAGAGAEAWAASTRGLSPADLAMHVALPEIDGRILTRAISFKQARPRDENLQFSRVVHAPMEDRVAFVADLASAWAKLRRTPSYDRRLACVLSDYPAKGGRVGYAVGLDTPASVAAIGEALRDAGYDVGASIEAEALIAHLSQGPEAGGHCLSPITSTASPRCRRRSVETSTRPGAIPKPTRPCAKARSFFASCARASGSSRCSPIAAASIHARASITTSRWRRATPMSRSTSGCARSSGSTR